MSAWGYVLMLAVVPMLLVIWVNQREREKHSMAQNKLTLPVIQRSFLAVSLYFWSSLSSTVFLTH